MRLHIPAAILLIMCAKNVLNMKTSKCRACKNKFIKKHINHVNCSVECKRKFEAMQRSKKPKQNKCKFCGLMFKPYTSLDKFCSSNCRIESQKSTRSKRWNPESTKNITGKNNPAYRNGTYCRGTKKSSSGEREFIKISKSIRNDMILDSGYIYCQNCNTSNSIKFECHHLVFRSEKPLHENLHNKDNLILLCIQCHNNFHKTKSLRDSIVKSRKLNLLFGDDVLNK